MHFSSSLTILGLAVASTTAVDIRFYPDSDSCGGRTVNCANMNPDVCCSLPGDAPNSSFSVEAIPGDWRVLGYGYYQNNCGGSISNTGYARGYSTGCVGGRITRSAKWFFSAGKRDVEDAPVAQDAQECSKPNQLTFEDGTQLELEGLTEEQYTHTCGEILLTLLRGYIKNFIAGVGAAELTAELAAFRK
ncbi:uncharacterized protein B0I36DRAFT_412603 [Microdochium trichocladiopsis]|uniref:Uncharacterized protein n=1 Tax=Microdochium trichocladiopsis TaxID=1682393 RepID=A0A9P8Y425_9PEZI|nr:uncharacterized protein B0I36DRAFT_412603 [Microdochium trichocladiopsis]KAH7027201.1 hypothetical protein B0I36DRAFT_412603 [Microdochium trichocladiopsis]